MKKLILILAIAVLAVAASVGCLIGASFRKASEAIRRSSGSNHPELLRLAVLAAEAPRHAGEATITNQLAKNYNDDRSSRRMTLHVRELLLSAAIDTCFSSEEILSAYMDSVYMGKGIAGLPAAARAYLGKSPHDLDAAECALLAGLIRSPTYYSPIRHLDRGVQRRDGDTFGVGVLGHAASSAVAALVGATTAISSWHLAEGTFRRKPGKHGTFRSRDGSAPTTKWWTSWPTIWNCRVASGSVSIVK